MTQPTPLATHLTLEEAIERLVNVASTIEDTDTVDISKSLGRVLAQALVSRIDVPPLANSAMDGYAVQAASVSSESVLLHVSQRITAGDVGVPLIPGTAARIFTGAPIPVGADAVVMQEDCEVLSGERVRIRSQPKPGQWIRPQGEDVCVGATVMGAGTRLTPAAIGLAATIGVDTVRVVRPPRVALFSTGNELQAPGQALKPGAIYNSNLFTLHALLTQAGCEVTDLGIIPDDLSATRAALRHAANHHDLILTTGGASVGDEDHIKSAVAAEGELHSWLLNTKPGRPLVFGRIGHSVGVQCLFLGLPGNPVSCLFGFVMLVRPLLWAIQGMPHVPMRTHLLRTESAWTQPDLRRREFLRASRTPNGGVALFPNQSSGVLTSMVWADGFIDNPAGHSFREGEMVRFLPFSEVML